MDFDPSLAGDDNDRGYPMVEPGEYMLTVRDAEERLSSKGNPMIALILEPQGHPNVKIFDYLVATEAAMFKVRQFCKAAGLVEKYDTGRLTETDCMGCIVKAEVVIEEGVDSYPDKNKVAKYIERDGDAPAKSGVAVGHAHPDTPVNADDIPF